MQLSVDVAGGRQVNPETGGPGGAVGVVARPSAFGAGPVSGGECDRLVVEEQERVVPGAPLLVMPALELQRAGDPEIAAVEPHDVPVPVEDAPVPRPRSP